MARCIIPEYSCHKIRIKADSGEGELILVGNGKRYSYLWVGNNTRYVFSGRKTLLKLAKTIIKVMG